MSFRKPCHMPFRKLIPPFTPNGGKPVVASPNVGCFLRLALFLFCFCFFCFVFLIKRAIEYLKSDHEWKSIISPHVRSSRFQNLERFFLMESGILGFEIWNSAQWIRNIDNDWNPEFKFHWQGIRPLESKIQECPGFIGIGRKLVLKIQWRIQGRGPGARGPAPRLLLDQSEAPKVKIFFFETGLPPYLRVSITALLPPPPPHPPSPDLKVWIHHWNITIYHFVFQLQ